MLKDGDLVLEGVNLLIDPHLFRIVTLSCFQANRKELLFCLVKLLILLSNSFVESDYLCLY